MTSSPDLISELRAARPTAPADLRARVRTIAAEPTARTPSPRTVSRSGAASSSPPCRRGPRARERRRARARTLGRRELDGVARPGRREDPLRVGQLAPPAVAQGAHGALDSTAAQSTGRAQQVGATLTVEGKDSNGVSHAAQDALDLTRSLGGYVVSSSVATGEQGNASIVVRIPVARVQEAITGLSGLGRIVSQQVQISDLQATLDQLEKREATVRGQIARIRARLATETLDPETEAALRAKLQTLRSELVDLRTGISTTNAEARMATVQLSVVTPDAAGTVVPASRIHRTIDDALNVLGWEGIALLGILIVLAPLALLGLAAWLGRRLYRKHEAERLLAT